jgi:hypothetical protein
MNIVLVFPLIWAQVLEELEVGSLAVLQRPYPGKEVVFSLTLGFSNHEAPKPMNLDAHNIST